MITGKHLVAVALLVCVCLGVATVYVWQGGGVVRSAENDIGILETPFEENIDLENFFLTHGYSFWNLDYIVDVIPPDMTTIAYRYRATCIGTYSEMLRVDYSMKGTSYFYITGAGAGKWKGENNQWTPIPDNDATLEVCSNNFRRHMYKLDNWTGEDVEWSVGGYTFRIYNVDNGPLPSDTVFQPS